MCRTLFHRRVGKATPVKALAAKMLDCLIGDLSDPGSFSVSLVGDEAAEVAVLVSSGLSRCCL